MTNQIVKAIVREIPDSFQHCITTQKNATPINVEKTKEQHRIYCDTLESLGIQLIRLEADELLPDCCFTEDTVIVLDEIAIISNPIQQGRKGENNAIINVLRPYRKLFLLEHPAYLDGGDVIRIGKKLFIGLSNRTNREAIGQVTEWVRAYGYKVITVPVKNTLHLKSACTYIGRDTVLLSPENVDPNLFSAYHIIEVPASESYCADALAIKGTVIIPEGFPVTRKKIIDKGFQVITLDTSEIKKADGALTCMSVLFRA